MWDMPDNATFIVLIEQATQDLLATPEDTPLPNDPCDWRAVSKRRENMSFIPVAVG
jgi:choline dehydrogenase